jgi:hypothetical protein
MRLLTFKIGQSRLALKVDSVISVGLDKTGDKAPETGALTLDLAGSLGLTPGDSPQKAVIKCSHQGLVLEIKADEVLGLENIDSSLHLAWPGVLSFLNKYSGVVMVGGQSFLTINLDSLRTGKEK